MSGERLPTPPLLTSLIDRGVWPRSADAARRQHLQPLVLRVRVKQFAPEEETIYLCHPPFNSVEHDISKNPAFWREFGALDEINPDLAMIIGDFGIGSDAPIVLDYRESAVEPAVLRLQWLDNPIRQHWVQVAQTFGEFANILGLFNA